MKKLYTVKYSGSINVEAWCEEHALEQLKLYIRDWDFYITLDKTEVFPV